MTANAILRRAGLSISCYFRRADRSQNGSGRSVSPAAPPSGPVTG